MRILATDGDDLRYLDTFECLDDFAQVASDDATYALEVAGVAYGIDDLYGPAHLTELLEQAVEVKFPKDTNPFGEPYEWSLHSEYLWGGCDLFACALKEICPEGEIYAMQEPDMQDSTRAPMLIHAGLRLPGDLIVDVLGLHGVAEWTAKWRERAETRKWKCRNVTSEDLDRLQGCDPGQRMTPEAIATVIPHATFVARLAGLVPMDPALLPAVAPETTSVPEAMPG
jgi:hypothetical protein